MKRIVIIATAVFLFTSFSMAQQPAADQPSREELTKMFEVLRVRQQTQTTMETVLAQMKVQLEGDIQKRYPNLPPDSVQKLESSINDAINLYPVDEMLADLMPVYQKYLTKADVEAIIGFYSSPAGQHFLDRMPTMTQEAMKTMMEKLQVRAADYAEKVQKQADDLAEPKKD
jgi:uncharacterized protein